MRHHGFRDLVQSMAERRPDAVAFISGDDRQACTWATFAHLVERRSQELEAEGGACEAIFCQTSLSCVVEIFAANAAGRQLALIDASLPLAGAGELVRAVCADRVFGGEEQCDAAKPHLVPVGSHDGTGSRLETPTPGNVLFFTSGTTARSKAVVLTDASLMASAYNGSALLPLSETDTLLCQLPLAHVFGFVCGLLWGLSCGATVALGRGMRHLFDDCFHFAPTALSLVPQQLAYLLRAQALNPELALVLIGAGDCPAELLDGLRARGIRASLGYGLTETSSGVGLSLGEDFHAFALCPDDEVRIAPDGEVLVRVPSCMMQGYWREPEQSAWVLRDGWLSTGDLGALDGEGRLHITGRKKDLLVLSSGTKIFLPEYEARVAAELGVEAQTLAVALRAGRPVLVVERAVRDARSTLDLLADCMAPLPFDQRLVDVVELGHPLPRTATGKIRRWELQHEVEKTCTPAKR